MHIYISGHGAELPYVFHTLEYLYSGDERELADTVSRYWGNFVNTGNPNIPPATMNFERYLDIQAHAMVSDGYIIATDSLC